MLLPEDEGDRDARWALPFVARLFKYREWSSLCSSLESELLSGFCTRNGARFVRGAILEGEGPCNQRRRDEARAPRTPTPFLLFGTNLSDFMRAGLGQGVPAG